MGIGSLPSVMPALVAGMNVFATIPPRVGRGLTWTAGTA